MDPLLQVRMAWDVRIPLRDGVTLSADLYRPQGDDPVQAIVIRTPYGKNTRKMADDARYFAERGYAVVAVDVRGRGDSEGSFVPYFGEGEDGYDVIEWVAQQPWCQGKVGTLGGSYLARIQWLAALQKPPHLAAMVCLVSPSDPFVEWPTGVPTPHHLAWMFLTSGRVVQNVDAVDWEKAYWHLPLVTMDEAVGRPMAHWREEFLHTHFDEFWERMSYQNRFAEIDLPVLHISGWYDDEQVGTPRNFAGMVKQAPTERARRSQKLIMGPWEHAVNTRQRIGEVDFGPQSLIDLQGAELRWFDYFLRGRDNGVVHEPPVSIFVMGRNVWREEREWPPARAACAKFYLHSAGGANSLHGDGVLSTARPQDEPTDGYTYDPLRPVPFITGLTSTQIGGPDDYAAIERRDDVLVYTSEVLAEPLEVTGAIKVELHAATDAPDTDFTAKLVDVWPNGFAQRIADGIVRARFCNGMQRQELLEPGSVHAYEIDCWYTSHTFLQGHCVRLEISSSAFPKYDRNPNTGEDLGVTAKTQIARQTVYHDAERPSALILPVIPND